MNEVNVIVEEIDDTIIVEVNPVNDEVTVVVDRVVNAIGYITTHSALTLDDGTDPHGITLPGGELSNVPNTDFTIPVGLNTDKVGVTTEEENTIDSITSGEPTGSDQVVNVVSLTQAEYDAGVIALTINATTIYNITDA